MSNIEIKTPPKLFNETQNLIQKLSDLLDGDFMSYWTSANSRIVGDDIIAFYEILKHNKKKDNLYLFIKSDGGSGEASLRIVNLLRKFYTNIYALIPLDCASAATMLALGADKIQMGPLAYLTAIDTSITHDLSPLDKFNDRVSVSQNELGRVLNLWDANKNNNDSNPFSDIYKYIHPLVIGSVDRATSLSIKLTSEILSYHMKDQNEAERISNTLNSEYPSHSYPITIREAQKIGLCAEELDKDVNKLLLELNELYSEMAQLAYTDFDEVNYHDNEILKVVEGINTKLFYQKDKDWHYRAEERRWVPMNDESSWRKMSLHDGNILERSFYVR
ncbi:ATP-dependent Clp protease proteolytic subunit [Soonwooa sp.]|uniref:ATP-dependent Clp protease proteolytic subunit n=1 Tax=Soonwooa sp. TaxID=1938592 RepID=UPI002637E498|nr:ATP-dependent Clp protease proteolytic subunit [Soonwooa sp.]